MDRYELRSSYNDSNWPSPYAKLLVINRKWDKDHNGNKIKRITHEQALNILSQRLNISIQEFLKINRKDGHTLLGFIRKNAWNEPETFCPIYPEKNKHYSYKSYLSFKW